MPAPTRPGHAGPGIHRAWTWIVGAVGAIAIGISFALDPTAASRAAGQDWSPFVLVAGLLLVGLVADQDGLFAAAGRRLGALTANELALLGGIAVLVVAVTAILNLDTSVAFLTPVVVHAVAHRDRRGDPAHPGKPAMPAVTRSHAVPAGGTLIAACLLLSNAGSLLLPGSNLTNLIVLGRNHLAGTAFFLRAAPAWAAAVVATVAVLAVAAHRPPPGTRTRTPSRMPPSPGSAGTSQDSQDSLHWTMGIGTISVGTVTVLVLVTAAPALPVLAVGLAACVAEHVRNRCSLRAAIAAVGPEVLAGLFGAAVALGAIGRAWNGPATLLDHLDRLATAALAAVAAVAVNNLPAASLLSARHTAHPMALLVGLNLGPNLFVSGSLSWLLWIRAARTAGGEPSISGAARLGLVAVPLSILAAVGALTIAGR